MSTPHARLDRFITETTTPGAIAKLLGVHSTYVWKLRRGLRAPSRKLANLIERHSATWAHGPIRATEWDGPYAGLVVANDNDVPAPPAAEGAA